MTSDRVPVAMARHNAGRGRPVVWKRAPRLPKKKPQKPVVPDPEMYFPTIEHLRDALADRVGEWVRYGRFASKKEAVQFMMDADKRAGENWAIERAAENYLSLGVSASKGDVFVIVRSSVPLPRPGVTRRHSAKPGPIIGPVGEKSIRMKNDPYGGLPQYTILLLGTEEEFVTTLKNNPGTTLAYAFTPTLTRATRHVRERLRKSHPEIEWGSSSRVGHPPMWDKYFQDEKRIAAGEMPREMVHGQITGTYYPPSQEKP